MNEPIWSAGNMDRKKGDTTFDICGWCEHASCGSVRYSCYLITSCSLLTSYSSSSDMWWDSACVIKKLGRLDFNDIVKSKQREIDEYQNSIAMLGEQIGVIENLKLADKPPLPSHRPHDYYNVDDVVYVFIEKKSEWIRGIVISGYRHHDGCVSYVLDDIPESSEGWSCGSAVPCVLKEWEYNYFRLNNADFVVWLELCDRTYNGEKLDLEEYGLAMGRF